jgi:hypothetical protein
MNSIREKLGNATLRIENMILLAGAIVDEDSLSPPLAELFDYDFDAKLIRECFPTVPDHVAAADDDDLQWQLVEWLIETETLGYLVQFATPVMRPAGASGMAYSWGNYYTKWVYADTLDGAVANGIAWSKKMRAKEKKKKKDAASARPEGGEV